MTYNQIVEHYGSLTKAAKALDFGKYGKQRIFAWKRIRIPTEVQMAIAAKNPKLKPDARAVREVTQWAATLVANGAGRG